MSSCNGMNASMHAGQVYGGIGHQTVDPKTGAIAMHPVGGTYVGGKRRTKRKESKKKKPIRRRRRKTLFSWLGQRGGDCGCEQKVY